MIRILLAAALALALMSPARADARRAHPRAIACALIAGAGGGGTGWHIAEGPCVREFDKARAINARRLARGRDIGGGQHSVRHVRLRARGATRSSAPAAGRIVAHPAGCPPVAFCGCGAAVRLFGAPIRSLWRAANWLRFPPAAPGPDMAAVRPHHVMVILAYHGHGMATVYDANSGGHLTRIHERALAGYRVVNPRAGRFAAI